MRVPYTFYMKRDWGIYFLVNRDFKIFEFVIREIHVNEELNKPWFVNQFFCVMN